MNTPTCSRPSRNEMFQLIAAVVALGLPTPDEVRFFDDDDDGDSTVALRCGSIRDARAWLAVVGAAADVARERVYQPEWRDTPIRSLIQYSLVHWHGWLFNMHAWDAA